jgi:Ni/Co efflux regulator RcnB
MRAASNQQEAAMLKSLTVSTLILGSVLAFAHPQVAAARDRDDYRHDRDRDRYERRDRERHEREERRERERWEHRYARDRDRGYYDRWGYWHWY